MTQYSGPGSQEVSYEEVRKGDMAIYRPLVEAGYIVVAVDGRGTGFRGEKFKKCTYGQLGRLETQDQIAAARRLAEQPYVDPARIGIYGWSFGGFVALNSILHGADVFALAVAVAPVTSWRYYDSIYTEIYNGLPADNPAGYDDNSPLNHAGLLRGRLLLIHGTGDDNVHVQNSYEMARALVAAGRKFDMMTYTDDNHSMMPAGSRHVRQKIVDYVIGNL
jgi:dipeptidyl-peptidase-4